MCPSFIQVVTCVNVLYIHTYTYIFKSFCVLLCFDILKMLPDWAATAPSRVSQFFVMARGQLGAGLWAYSLSNPESYLLYVMAFTSQETILWCFNYPKTWYQAAGDHVYSCKPTGVIQASQTSWSELFILPFPPRDLFSDHDLSIPSFALSSASRPPLCLSHVVLQSMPYHPSLGPGSELTLFSWACPELCLTDHHVNKHRKAKWYSTCVCCIWFTHLSLWGHMTWSRLFAAVNIDVLVCLSLWF